MHAKAEAILTANWQNLCDLREKHKIGSLTFESLVHAGYAETYIDRSQYTQTEAIGSRTYYRLPNMLLNHS